MDCNFIEKNEMHEKYLLHKLNPADKMEYEQHLQDCTHCQKELEHQRLIIGGLRQMGREEMKLEIKRQVELHRQKSTGVNWSLILKTAAVILFFVLTPGMIYYYQYYVPVTKTDQKAYQYQTEESVSQPAEPVAVETEQMPKKAKLAESKGTGGFRSGEDAESPTVGRISREESVTLQSKRKSAPIQSELAEVPDKVVNNNLEMQGRSRKKMEPPSAISGIKESDELQAQADEGIIPSKNEVESNKIYRFDKIQVPGTQTMGKTSKMLFSETGRSTPAADQKQLHYTSLHQNINVILETSDLTAGKADQPEFPAQFPVIILNRDSTKIDMIWQVNQQLYKIDPNQITLQVPDTNTIQVDIQNKYDYRIDLKSPNTQAILQK